MNEQLCSIESAAPQAQELTKTALTRVVNALSADQIAKFAASPRGDDRVLATLLTIEIETCPRPDRACAERRS